MAKLASLEHKLLVGFAIPIITLAMLALGMIYYFELTLLSAITLLLGVVLPSVFALSYGYRAVMQVLESLAVQLDGVTNEEFGVWQLAQYRNGRVELLNTSSKKLPSDYSKSVKNMLRMKLLYLILLANSPCQLCYLMRIIMCILPIMP